MQKMDLREVSPLYSGMRSTRHREYAMVLVFIMEARWLAPVFYGVANEFVMRRSKRYDWLGDVGGMIGRWVVCSVCVVGVVPGTWIV